MVALTERVPYSITIALLASLFMTTSAQAKINYKKWMNEEVVWIISEKERDEFKNLKDDAARDEFITRFWRRRDPTPSTERNEYKEEHYRRFIFAKKMFQEGKPGWKTDRGRIYIIHGPPDAQYFRTSRSAISPIRELPRTERSPNTIVWAYHQNPNAQYYKGEIRLIFQPSAGLSRQNFALSDSGLAQQRADELARHFFPASDPNWLEADVRYQLVMAGPPALMNAKGADLPSSGMAEFSRYLDDLFHSPGDLLEERQEEIKRRERARAELRKSVKTQVSFGEVNFGFSTQVFYRPAAEWLISLKISLNPEDLKDEKCDLYAALIDDQGEVFDEFIDSLELNSKILEQFKPEQINYLNTFSAPSGEYRLRVVVREVGSQRTGYQEKPIVLAVVAPSKVTLGSMILTNRVEVLPEGDFDDTQAVESSPIGNNIVFNNARLLPNPSNRFNNGGYLFLYFQIWVPPDRGEISINANFIQDGQIVKRLTPRIIETSDRTFVEYGTVVPLTDFGPGNYTFQLQALDHTSKTFDIQRASFIVLEPLSE
ncbi:GWxTD domain-containing protein [Acidobacteria bacterium AH-259-G07]|nr:GWxTD domain-containing protein [Acidobacteria bacterium AH-259-G07]